jgi:hypothetical protein
MKDAKGPSVIDTNGYEAAKTTQTARHSGRHLEFGVEFAVVAAHA